MDGEDLGKQPRNHDGGGAVLGADGGEPVHELDELGVVVRGENGNVHGAAAVGNRLCRALYKGSRKEQGSVDDRPFAVSK